jgi:hypothetical protein
VALNPTNSNSNVKIQDVVDEVAVIGDLTPVLKNTGGYADQPALTIANNVMQELIAERFPWKWNRLKIPPFVLTPLQQDYPSQNIGIIGWVENGVRIDINNTQVPPPSWPVTAVRDLAIDNSVGGFPGEYCWFPNDQLEYAGWPGPGIIYTNPISQTTQNNNKQTSILNPDGDILTLTKYGVTGLVPPVAPPWTPPPSDPDAQEPEDYPVGIVIVDGTCEWTVCDPHAQGFRFTPRPPSGGNVWLCRLFAQRKAPPRFVNLQQYLDPIPDDYMKWFTDGFIAYAHRYSSNPAVTAKFQMMRQNWLDAMGAAAKQGDREDESKGFFPDRPIASPTFVQDQGPYPYRWQGGWG